MSELTRSIKHVRLYIREQPAGHLRLIIFACRELIAVLIIALLTGLHEAACTFVTAMDLECYLQVWAEIVRNTAQGGKVWTDHRIILWPVKKES